MRSSSGQLNHPGGPSPPLVQGWERALTWDDGPKPGNYRLLMIAPTNDERRVAFGFFIRRVIELARARGLTILGIERTTGVPKSTFYRWRDAVGQSDPDRDQVKQFLDRLDVPREPAFDLLGWKDDDDSKPALAVAPEPGDPDVERLIRKLRDPAIPDDEKRFIRENLRMLAARPVPRDSRKSG